MRIVFFFLPFEKAVRKITTFEFFFSIDMKMWCNKSETSVDNAIMLYQTNEKQTQTQFFIKFRKKVLNECHIYVMKNSQSKDFFSFKKT